MTAPRAILLDMDGTITRPMLDFAAIRAEMGVPADVGILEWLETVDVERQQIAREILDTHEDRAARQSVLNEGCDRLLEWLESRSVATAVITRNSKRCASIVFERHALSFATVITREDEVFKPDPAPLRLACTRLGINCAEAWMVGDGEFDVCAGLAAGCPTIWLSHGRIRPFSAEPWRSIADLVELRNLLADYVS